MSKENSGMAGGVFIGFVAGTIVGAVLALLYAPKTGRELRSEIRQKADEVVGDAEEYLEKAKKRAGEIITEGKKRADTVLTDARKRADTLMNDAERILSTARDKMAGQEKS